MPHVESVLGLNRGRGHFFNFLGAPSNYFRTQKVYFLAVNASLCGLNNVSGVYLVQVLASYLPAGFVFRYSLPSHWLEDCENFMPTPEENDQYSANHSQCNTSSQPIHFFYKWKIQKTGATDYEKFYGKDKNKHLTLLSQRKLALIARNTLFAL